MTFYVGNVQTIGFTLGLLEVQCQAQLNRAAFQMSSLQTCGILKK